MNILLASSEVFPFSKTGGLADMVGSLAKALKSKGNEVVVVSPLYRGIREQFPKLRRLDWWFDLPLGGQRQLAGLWELVVKGQPRYLFVDHPGYFQRAGIYSENNSDYADNPERFIFFSKCVVDLTQRLPRHADVVHVHDWPTALVPALMAESAGQGWGRERPLTCLTIHNVAFQGFFPAESFALTNLPQSYFATEAMEFFGGLNCLKAGIIFADRITTVSPSYAKEITTAELGCGLDGVLRQHANKLRGILNGVDYSDWNTTKNPHLFAPYSSTRLDGKKINKRKLQKLCGLPVDETIPLFGTVSRLSEQKGVGIQLAALEEMLNANIQFVQLGNGAAEFEAGYRELARRYPGKVSVNIGFDEKLSHQIEAGCDFFLMPSRFEPCGLNQMYSLRYGTIPIVRATGGLNDTVIDFTESSDQADGIKFQEFSAPALAKAIRKALAIYESPTLLKQFQLNGMKADFSWPNTVDQYLRTYSNDCG